MPRSASSPRRNRRRPGSESSTPPACPAARSIPSTRCSTTARSSISASPRTFPTPKTATSAWSASRSRCHALRAGWRYGHRSSVSRPRRCSRSLDLPQTRSGLCGRAKWSSRSTPAPAWMALTRRGPNFVSSLFALEVRRALVQEGIHALAKVLAHIGAKDQILALFARQRPPDAAHRLFCHLERDRRMAGEEFCRLVGALLQRRDVRHHFVE